MQFFSFFIVSQWMLLVIVVLMTQASAEGIRSPSFQISKIRVARFTTTDGGFPTLDLSSANDAATSPSNTTFITSTVTSYSDGQPSTTTNNTGLTQVHPVYGINGTFTTSSADSSAATSTTGASSGDSTNDDSTDSGGLSVGAILGLTFGIPIGCLALLCCVCRGPRRSSESEKQRDPRANEAQRSRETDEARHWAEHERQLAEATAADEEARRASRLGPRV